MMQMSSHIHGEVNDMNTYTTDINLDIIGL